MPHPTALLIEDDGLTAKILEDWLTGAGWEVVTADSGTAGLRRIGELRPTLVVADIVLPGLDGTTLCAHVRMQPFGERTRVVLVSSRGTLEDAALASGADAFLCKPLDRDSFLAAVTPPAVEPPAEPVPPRAIRLPRADTLGVEGGDTVEEGPLGPGTVLPLLRRLHDQRWSGVLEAEGPDGFRAKISFSNGMPAAARSSDADTGLGQVAMRLGLLNAERLEDLVEEGRRTSTPLGEVLLRTQLVDRRGAERALREQVLVRTVGLAQLPSGSWRLDPAEPIGLAGFDVHPAVVAWRVDPAAAPELTPEELAQHVRIEPAVLTSWGLFDPEAELGVLRALLVGGATAADCGRVCGPRAAALVATLKAWGLVRLEAEAPGPAAREAGLAELDAGRVAEALLTDHHALLDADHYTLLGLPPSADAEAVSAATAAAIARFDVEALPATLDAPSRQRARGLYERVVEAGRVLSDPARRAIYDARLAGDAQVRHGQVGLEDHAVLLAERARALFRIGEHVTAATLFQMATLLEGESADILAMLGWARHRACPEDPTAGEDCLRRALVLAPGDETVLTYLGRLLAARGERDEARRLLRAALEENHAFEPARDALRELGEP